MADRVRMPSAASIVARSYPDKIIGIENTLPWHLRTDLQLFKKRTLGHAVIMGRKTFESIGKPLPNRVNIILSRSKLDILDEYPSVKWAADPETALYFADVDSIISGNKEFFIIGGEQIYNLFNKFMNRVFVTDVFCGNINGDAKFDVDFAAGDVGKRSEWIIKREEEYPKTVSDDYPFRVTEYRRRMPLHRYRVKEEAMGRVPDVEAFWLSKDMHLTHVDQNDAQLNFWESLDQ
ncbi:dihydrofolate reductase [Allorhizobium terrae]|nr:dihydrofolate reductase [Allorhizobium terrae]